MSVNMFDAAFPPAATPAGFRIVAGYIGGHTPHTWTRDEWDRYRGLKKLPIWVPGPAVHVQENAEADGWQILEALYNLNVPKGSAVVLDMETSEAPNFDRALEHLIMWGGYRPWVYGSKSTISQNPGSDYWVADYTHQPHFTGIRGERACQWTDGQEYDQSLVKDWQFVNRLHAW